MRILHTSDWHLGQNFMGQTRQREHQALIDWLLLQVEQQQVDAVLIAGDLFDTGTPPSYARELYNQLVLRMHALQVPLLLLAGNHDSVATLHESAGLLQQLGARVVASADSAEASLIRVEARDGGAGCIVCAIPFIRPRDIGRSEAGQSADDKRLSLQQAIADYYQRSFQAACSWREQIVAEGGPRLPIVATGHLTTVGASSSESVREIYVGSLDAFPTSAFPPADYIALGHIHRPQQVGGLAHIRYSGSPLALSFDEAGQGKQVWLVDLDAGGLQTVSSLPVPEFQALRRLQGDLAGLPGLLQAAAAQGSQQQPVWLEVSVVGDEYLADLPARVQALADGLPLQILRLRRQRAGTAAGLNEPSLPSLDQLQHDEVFARRLQDAELGAELEAELQLRYRQIASQVLESP